MSMPRRMVLAAMMLAACMLPYAAWAQTAQSVQLGLDIQPAYAISSVTIWEFDGQPPREKAVAFFDQYFDLTVESGTITPDANTIDNFKKHANFANKENFWTGAPLQSYTDVKQTAKDLRYGLTATPKAPGQYPAHTGWHPGVTEAADPTVVPIDGFIACESCEKAGAGITDWTYKYSFLLQTAGVLGVQNLAVALQKKDGETWANVGTPITPATLLETGVDWDYWGNVGTFGDNTLWPLLHVGIPEEVSEILQSDDFAGNNDVATNSERLWFNDAGFTITAPGDYRLRVTCTVKGNAVTVEFPFTAVANLDIRD